jgi:DNA-binding beta-propeller fold protein YncE
MRRGVHAAAVLLALGLAAPASGAYRQVDTWGRLGSGPGEFGSGVLGGGANRQYDDPAGISLSGDGSAVFVVDTSNNRVEKFSRSGAFQGQFGSRGRDSGAINRVSMKGRFYQPAGFAVGPNGLVYVVDSGNDRVMVHAQGGAFVRRIGHHGSKRGEWVQPWGATTFGSTLFVVDQGNYRVQRWTLDGGYLGAWGGFGRRRGQFVTPYDVAVSPGGDRVYVTDSIRRKVIVFGPTGSLIGEFGQSGTGAGRFLKPAGVAVARDGTLFVADRCNRRIDHLTADGGFIESFGGGTLETPTFLAVDESNRVYVSDYRRVVVFAPTSQLARPSSLGRASQRRGFDVACSGIRP